jgi:SNF2 family DNA or RNA helicase
MPIDLTAPQPQLPCDSYKLVQLHDYQKFAHDFILTHPYAGLFLDMGMGKTLTTLSALYDLNPNGNVLIVAPKNIARSTWLDEIAKWKLPLRTCSFVVNEKDRPLSKAKRHELYEKAQTAPPAIYFINRELVCDLVEHTKHWCYPIVVLDEAQSFKTYNSARFKALKKVRPQIQRLIELTGTPSPNGLMDLWSQIYLLDEGERLGRTITAYRNRFFYPGMIVNGYPVKWIPKPGAEQEIYELISDLVISMKNTALTLPPLTMNNVYVHMEPKEKKLYDEMKKEYVLSFKTGVAEDDVVDVIAANAAVLSAKLRQMASGALYVDDAHNYRIIHRRKLEHVAYLLRSTSSPVIIAYHFQTDRIMLETYLTSLGFDVQSFDGSAGMIRAWNAGQIPVMLLQPASAGHGLNLQDGGHTLIWYTIPWSLEEYQQTNARLYRQGQTDPVVIHHILTKGTIDEQVLRAIDKKDMSQSQLIDAVMAEF